MGYLKRIFHYGIQHHIAPGSVAVNWTNDYNQNNIDFDWDAWPITNSQYRYRGFQTGNGTSTVYHPWGIGDSEASSGKSILIDTVTLTTNKLRRII